MVILGANASFSITFSKAIGSLHFFSKIRKSCDDHNIVCGGKGLVLSIACRPWEFEYTSDIVVYSTQSV